MGVALTHKSIKTTMILITMMMPFQAQDQVLQKHRQNGCQVCVGGHCKRGNKTVTISTTQISTLPCSQTSQGGHFVEVVLPQSPL